MYVELAKLEGCSLCASRQTRATRSERPVHPRTRKGVQRTHTKATREDDHRAVPSTSEMARVVRATPNPQDMTRTRIPFDRQVRSQAADGAAGYRPVLLMQTQAESPRIIPSADASGALRDCRLDPFEPPDGLRLQDGHSYRMTWHSFARARNMTTRARF